MQISAKYQAVYEILSQIMKDQYPADNIIKEYVRNRKYIGSKDRKFITSTVWILSGIAAVCRLIVILKIRD